MPVGFTVGGFTAWALRLTEHLLEKTPRRVNWVLHDAPPGYIELEPAALPRHPRFTLLRAPSLHHRENWSRWTAAYRTATPSIILPALLEQSYAITAALAMSQAEQLRVVAWNHSDHPYEYTLLSRYAPIAHAFITNSTTCTQNLRSRINNRSNDIRFIPHGVPSPRDTSRGPAAGRPIRLAYGGRIDQIAKRVLDLPSLAHNLYARGIAFEMRIVGDGPVTAELNRLITDWKHERGRGQSAVRQCATIQFESARPPQQMHELWHWADIALLMSAHEGLSVAMLEAMAAGCVPVVSAVESGVGDVIRDGCNGRTFPIGDMNSAAACIESLAADPTRLAALSGAAATTIRDLYDLDQHAVEIERIFQQVESAAPRPWPTTQPVLAEAGGRPGVDTPGELTVPTDAGARLKTLLNEIARRDAGSVAIYGAGRHTRALADVWAESPVEIVAVIDDDPAHHGKTLWGWPIVGPDDVAGLDARHVVISSWLHENDIWERRGALQTSGLTVHRLYGHRRTPIDALITLLVWDAHEAVSRLLESLQSGISELKSWRLFILDQGSGDSTADLLGRFAAAHEDRVTLVRLERNIGYPAGHNLLHRRAIERFDPRFLVTLNSDLVFHDNRWLDSLVSFMDARPKVGIAGPTGVIYQREPAERLGWCRLADADELRDGRFDSISGSLCIIRQSMIDEIGLFDEVFTPGYYEDTDLAIRAKSSGWQLGICPIPHGHHDLGPEKSTSHIKREQLAAEFGNFQKRNRDVFVERWLSGRLPDSPPAEPQAIKPVDTLPARARMADSPIATVPASEVQDQSAIQRRTNIQRHPDARVASTARFDVGPNATLILAAGCQIRDNAHIEVHDEGVVHIGPEAVVGVNNWIQGNGDVTVGELTCLGPNVVILSTTHQIDLAFPIQHQPLSKRRTVIGRDVWIGANTTIAAGVNIADHAVIGANSFVNRDVSEAAIAHGAPAREHARRTVTPKQLRIVFPIAVGFNDRPERCHAVARFFATMGNTLREIGVESWYVCHPRAVKGLDSIRADRKFIREDHRDFGQLLDQMRPDVMFLWNGATDAHQITKRFAEERRIPIRYAELGWLPQSTTMYFDLEGTNARSSIRRLDLSRVAIHPGLDEWLDQWRNQQLSKTPGRAVGDPACSLSEPRAEFCRNGYIFVPLQDERDVNITLASPYPSMNAFVTALSWKFPNERFVVRPHPQFSDVAISPRPNLMVTTEGFLHSWIQHADAVVGINSTVLIESLAWNKPTHSVGAGVTTGLDVMYESDGVEKMTLRREIDSARCDRIRRLLSELIFRRQFDRRDLHILDRLRAAHGVADLLEFAGPTVTRPDPSKPIQSSPMRIPIAAAR